MMIELKDGERLDELQRNGYRIIQNPGRFCFGMDAVLLSGFARVKEGSRTYWRHWWFSFSWRTPASPRVRVTGWAMARFTAELGLQLRE